MDRQIATLGSLPRSYEFNQAEQFAMKAIGYALEAAMGPSAWAYGLGCVPTSPASLSVLVGRGTLGQLSVLEATAFGSSLLADTTDPLMKAGINLAATTLTFVPPSTAGQSQCFLIEGQMQEADGTPLVLPFYNAANPAVPFSGPGGSGAATNTQRLQTVALQVVPGAPAATGSQTIPGVTSGWVPLYVITLANGQTTITTASIAVAAGAPFITVPLPDVPAYIAGLGYTTAAAALAAAEAWVTAQGYTTLAGVAAAGYTTHAGFSNQQVFSASGNFTVPAGVTRIKVRLVGGGGGGGSGSTSQGGGGGGAGGYAEGVYTVTPGASIAVTIGAGGTAGIYGGTVSGQGGSTIFGSYCSATGGLGGLAAATYAYGGAGGAGTGGAINEPGGYGTDGNAGSLMFPGNGGASAFGGGGRGATAGGAAQANGQAAGSGAGGCYQVNGNGGVGAPGLVIVEY
jgi:hypothetical protein